VSVAQNLAGVGGMSVNVRAQSDTIVRIVTVSLTVQDAPIYTLVLPQFVSIKQGSSGTVTVDPLRGAYVGPVNLSVTGLPAGMTASFAQNPISGYTSTTATISVGAGVAVGQYILTFSANAPGGTPVTAQLTVYVTP